MATIHTLPVTEEPSDLRNFINRLNHAERKDIEALTRDARRLGKEAVSIVKTTLITGADDRRNTVATVAIGANLTTRTPIQEAFYFCLLDSTDTLLHELLLPVIVDLAKCGATAAGKTLMSYIKRGDSEQIRYAQVLRANRIDPRKYVELPLPKVVGEIGPR